MSECLPHLNGSQDSPFLRWLEFRRRHAFPGSRGELFNLPALVCEQKTCIGRACLVTSMEFCLFDLGGGSDTPDSVGAVSSYVPA